MELPCLNEQKTEKLFHKQTEDEMKAANLTTTVKKASIVLLTALFLATTVGAQNVKAEKSKPNKLAIENLIKGIKSDNDGLKRDCIYYAAIYGVGEAADVLKSELKSEDNPSTRVLIALALYKLGVKTDEAVLTGYVSIDWDAKLKNMAETFKDKFQQNVTVSGGKN